MRETVVHIPHTLPALVAKAISRGALQHPSSGGVVPSWCAFDVSIEDWAKGYRQVFPTQHQMRFNAAACLHPRTHQWLFALLRGLPFGLASAVNQFARCAALLTAFCRRLLLILCGHYVDDNVIVEIIVLMGHAHKGFRAAAECMGIALSDKKRQTHSTAATFLGCLFDFSTHLTDHATTCEPKLYARENIIDEFPTSSRRAS